MAVPNSEAVQWLPSGSTRAESRSGRIGPIILEAKQTGERSAGNPHAAFDEAGAENVARPRWCDTRRRKSEPTGNTNFGLNRRVSPRPYLAAFRLHDANDHLLTVDVARSQPHHFAGPQPATIRERQHRPRLEARRHGQNTLDLLRAQYRQLLRLLDMPDLGRQIVTTQGDAEQEAHPGHDPVSVADAGAALDEVQLEAAHLVGRRCIG